MFITKNSKILLYEICDKDYGITLSQSHNSENIKYELSRTEVSKSEIVKNNILEQFLSKHYEIMHGKKEEVYCLSTGFEEIDDIIGGGLKPGLYVIGANPGLGKTSLALQIMQNLALDKKHSLIFNLEMSQFQIVTKLLSNFSYRKSLQEKGFTSFTINELSTLSMNKNDGEFDKSFLDLCKDYVLSITPYVNVITYTEENNYKYVELVETALENYMKFHKIKPLIVIDFLQLLQLNPVYDDDGNINTDQDRRLEMDKIIRILKKYSNKYGVAIIVISSLSRSGYTKENYDYDPEYSLSIFKETGQIEYTADFIALLTRGETKIEFGEKHKEIINVNVLKNRYGKTGGKIQLEFVPSYAYFKKLTKKGK